MARLIDADKFLSSMIKRFKCVPLIGRNDYDCESLKQMLIEAPTVDAVPVMHGRWMDFESDPMWQQCSACEYIIQYSYSKDCKYCPNCGADMRGKENG